MEYKKPPIGIMPEIIWKQKRWEELGKTIIRHIEEGYKISEKWLEEYNRLDDEIKELAIK